MTRTTIDLKASNISLRNESVTRFLNDIVTYRYLDAEAEAQFFYDYMAVSDPAVKTSMKQKFLSGHCRILYSFAKKYESDPSKVLDLVNEAYIGMDIAFDRFDVTRGVKFISFAADYIRRSIRDYVQKVSPTVVPSNVSKIGARIPKIRNKFYAENGREPSIDEIIEILERDSDIKVSNVSDVFEVSVFSVSAGNGSSVDDDSTIEEVGRFAMETASRNDVEDEIENDSLKTAVRRAMSILSTRERQVITLLFGLDGREPMTPDDVAMELCEDGKNPITGTRICQIRTAALKKMKEIKPNVLYA